jgi:hypothetical protein
MLSALRRFRWLAPLRHGLDPLTALSRAGLAAS